MIEGKKGGSRHCEVANYLVVAESIDARAGPQKTGDISDLRYPPDDPPTVLELFMRLSMGLSLSLMREEETSLFLCLSLYGSMRLNLF